MSDARKPPPKPPAHVAPYIDALGIDKAAEFLLSFGGAPIYLSDSPGARSQVAAAIGAEGVRALKERLGESTIQRVPTADKWLARYFEWQGLKVNEIARRLRTSNVTVRKYLRDGDDARQLRMFG